MRNNEMIIMVRILALFQNVMNLLLVVLLGCVIYGKHVGSASPDDLHILLLVSLAITSLVVMAGILRWFYERRESKDFRSGHAIHSKVVSESNVKPNGH